MPELSGLKPWNTAKWDNPVNSSGAGNLKRRPYYYKIVGAGEEPRILIISAVQNVDGSFHAVDYLRLDHNGFTALMQVGEKAFGSR